MNQPNDKGKSASPVKASPQPAASGGGGGQMERPCPECGESVRKGLVRCWNCGAFMDSTLQAKYQEMQTKTVTPIFSQVPDSEVTPIDVAGEDDFRLGAEVAGAARRADLRELEAYALAPTPAAPAPVAEAPGQAHSIATAGDVLFAAAMEEQAENRERRKKRPSMLGGARTPNGFIIFCPYGCRIEVREQHRGSQGRCPRCRAPFLVPIDPPLYVATKSVGSAEGSSETAADTGRQWLEDLHLHVVPPERLKLKADSLLREYFEQDFGFSPEGIVRINLAKKAGGMFGGGAADKNKSGARAAVRLHLQENRTLATAPAGEARAYTVDQLQELGVVQPAMSRAQSLFHGIPVFGTGRIAIMLPLEDDGAPRYVSLGITQFRKLAAYLQQFFGIVNFGAGSNIPATDEYDVVGKCHYMATPVRGLKNLEYYQADPTVELVLSGWKCDKCPVVMSEEGRSRDKFGGKDGKGIAKTKCPKCAQKFGNNPLYVLKDSGTAARLDDAQSESASPIPSAT